MVYFTTHKLSQFETPFFLKPSQRPVNLLLRREVYERNCPRLHKHARIVHSLQLSSLLRPGSPRRFLFGNI